MQLHGTSLAKRLAMNKQETCVGAIGDPGIWHDEYARRLIGTLSLSELPGQMHLLICTVDWLTVLLSRAIYSTSRSATPNLQTDA